MNTPEHEPDFKCATFDAAMQAAIPPDIRAKMDADRTRAEAERDALGLNQRSPALSVALGSAAWLRATAEDQEEMLHAIGALDEEGERETKREILGLRIAADQADELVVWVKRLVQVARKSDRNSDIAGRAMDYLKRERLLGSPLR